jgi:uncharacterized Zn finger protein (UPF0148 family)
MADLHGMWLHEMARKLKETGRMPRENCPRCHSHRLNFDPKTGRLWCPDCGFEAYVPVYS